MPGSVLDLVTLRRAARFRASGEDHAVRPGEPEVAKGTLILVGGGAKSRRIWRRFIQAAGGVSAPIVVIPTAAGRRSAGAVDARTLRTLGVLHVTVLHATDKREIESDAFLAPLRCAKGIWFTGGRQWRLVDAYEGTKALALFHDVLRRGGVIGGSSAGTSIQGEFMVRGNPLGNAEIYMEGYERGFGFLPGAGVDQHFTERRRLPDMKLLMRTYPKLLGIGIDESTAIVVQKRSFTVIGPGQVFVCGDGAAWTALRRGEQYDMARREKLPPAP